MKKFNEYIKENIDFSSHTEQESIFGDIQSDIEQIPQDEVNDYLQEIIDYCQSLMV